jgi:hypothetical protein
MPVGWNIQNGQLAVLPDGKKFWPRKRNSRKKMLAKFKRILQQKFRAKTN